MAVRSILFASPRAPGEPEGAAEPEYFRDLNLDQVVAAIAKEHPGAGLESWFHLPLRDAGLVAFRQRIFHDLEDPAVRGVAERFTAALARTRRRLELVGRMKHPPQAHRWFLEIVLEYAALVTELAEGLAAAPLTAPGLLALRDDIAAYVRDAAFTGPRERASRLRERLGEVRYDLLLRGEKVTVVAHDPDVRFDYAERVLAVFERFGRDRPPEHAAGTAQETGLDHLEAKVLDFVVELAPGVFRDLAAFGEAERGFMPGDVLRLERELRFYLGYLAHLAPLREAGLPFCLPEVSTTDKRLAVRDVFDLALASSPSARGRRVVGNDVRLEDGERVLVVSGPNQGGKTTLSRAFGQLHHLAALGCPVPGREARVFLPDRILTHYERAESLEGQVSKLEEELLRMRAILEQATPDSVVILNEIFTSTTWDDARALSEAVLTEILRLDAVCLWVSFVDELSRLDPRTVSMVGEVAGEDAERTYKVVRRPADGRAYAMTLAERHGLTRAQIIGRMRR